MNRVIAFLHGINVGGRLVANEELRAQFEVLGYERVRSFISTGNIVFDLPTRPTATIERRIERRLADTLGFEVPTFLRTEAELKAIVKHRAFDIDTLYAAREMNVGFVGTPLSSDAIQRLMKLRGDVDQFHVNDREVYWLCRTRRQVSSFTPEQFTASLRVPVTFRPLSTLIRMLPWIEAERPSASRLASRRATP